MSAMLRGLQAYVCARACVRVCRRSIPGARSVGPAASGPGGGGSAQGGAVGQPSLTRSAAAPSPYLAPPALATRAAMPP
jgi:hypothetical protein